MRALGGDIILDTNYAADVVIMEEGTELLNRLKKSRVRPSPRAARAWITRRKALPRHPADAVVDQVAPGNPGRPGENVSGREDEIDPKKMRVISIMPCTARRTNRPAQLTNHGLKERCRPDHPRIRAAPGSARHDLAGIERARSTIRT